jgi:hypothetical protein
MPDPLPYWRPPPVGSISDFPAEAYEQVRENALFWGDGFYSPDYEYASREENCQLGIPLPWPMTSEEVTELLEMAKKIVLLATRLPPENRDDVISAHLQRTLMSELGLEESEISERERSLIEKELRHLRRRFINLIVGVHGYEEKYVWRGELGVRFFLKNPGPRTKVCMEFFYA